MPRRGITAYDLLISCPGDVIEFIGVIRECIDNFMVIAPNILDLAPIYFFVTPIRLFLTPVSFL